MSSFADLEKCIQANISAPNNDIRKNAESHLKELKQKHPQQFFEGVSQCIAKSNDDNVRSFAAVLLKQHLGIFDDTFFKLPFDSQTKIKQLLLHQIQSEQNRNVSVQVATAISHLMCLILQNKNAEWKDLMPSLHKLSSSDIAYQRSGFYTAIDKLACNAVDVLRCSNMQQLRDILISGLRDKHDLVRESALSAVVALLCSLTDNNELNYFMNIVPLLFNNINGNMSDKTICNTCQNLQVLADNQPNFFVNSMLPIVECLAAVTKHKTLEWDTRKLSMHLLLTLLNFHCNQIQPNLMDVGKQVIPLIFDFLSTFDENLEWNTPQDDAEQINYLFGAEMLPLVVSIFGADIFLNVTQPVFDAGFANTNKADWKQRLIALKTVEVTLEGAVEHYEEKVNYIVQSTGRSLADKTPYVQYAALSVIKQLSVVFGDDKSIFLIPFADSIMNALGNMLNNAQQHHRCVLIQVCDAIAHFAYMDEENEVITKYASSILKGLFNLLECNDNLVQSYALKAISVIASVIQEAFAQFYSDLMQYCKQLLHKIYDGQTKDDSGLLRGRCMECIGGMLLVVDIDTCRADAHHIIKYLLQFQKQEEANTSESLTYMMTLFAAIAEALTNEFVPYIQHVIPPLLKCAQKRALSVGMNKEEEKKQNPKDDIVVEQFGGIKFQVNTAELNEKSVAIQQFPRYAVCLEGELLQFVNPISSVLIPLIKSRGLSSEVRRHALETFAPLVNCLKCGLLSKKLAENEVNKWCTEFAEKLLVPLIDGMNLSDEVDEFSLICKTIQDLLDYIDCGLFKNVSVISDITEQIRTAMDERQTRRALHEEQSIDFIDTDVEEDVEADLADTIVDLVAKLVRKFGSKYVGIFDKYCGKTCTDLLNVNNDATEEDLILALSMLTEIVNHGGNEANKYVGCVLGFAQQSLSQSTLSAPVKQSICYAIGICAVSKGLNANDVPKWLSLLKNIVDAKDSHNEDNINATENAISAIAKICKGYEGSINNQFIVDWMKMLPLIYDDEERDFCNEYLLSILQKTSLLRGVMESNNAEMIAKLVHIIAVSLVNEDKAKSQYQDLFNHLKSKCKSDVIQQSIQCLSEDLQSAFKQ